MQKLPRNSQISVMSDETVDQFVLKPRQRAVSCDFGVLEDDYIRDQVIDKCYSSHLRAKVLFLLVCFFFFLLLAAVASSDLKVPIVSQYLSCYQLEHFNLHRESSVSDRSLGIINSIYERVIDGSLNTCLGSSLYFFFEKASLKYLLTRFHVLLFG